MIPVDQDLATRVRSVLAGALPGYEPAEILLLGTGTDHLVVEVDGTLVIRLTTGSVRAGSIVDEAALLRALAGVVSVPVPLPVVVDEAAGALAHRRIPGLPLLGASGVDPLQRRRIAQSLGELLAELHGLTDTDLGVPIPLDDAPLQEYRDDAIRAHALICGDLPVEARPAVEAFLARPVPPEAMERVFSHRDLGIEHVLVQDAVVTGIIDWSDAAIGDPARDLGLLLRDLGADGLAVVLGAYRRRRGPATVDADLSARIIFHARCALLEDWAYGLTPDAGRDAYRTKSVARVAELFSERPSST